MTTCHNRFVSALFFLIVVPAILSVQCSIQNGNTIGEKGLELLPSVANAKMYL